LGEPALRKYRRFARDPSMLSRHSMQALKQPTALFGGEVCRVNVASSEDIERGRLRHLRAEVKQSRYFGLKERSLPMMKARPAISPAHKRTTAIQDLLG
jgi:hypothetical protein